MTKPRKSTGARVRSWRHTLAEVYANWSLHGDAAQSAALAFYTLFSLAPVLMVVIAVAGAVFGKDAVRGRIYAEFQGLMGHDAALLVQDVLRSAAHHPSGKTAAAIGIATLVFGATGVFVQLQEALNRVWGVAPQPGANFTTLLRKRLLSFALVIGLGFLLAVSLVLSAALAALSQYLGRFAAAPPWLLEGGNFLLSFAAVTLLFAAIYRLLPDVRLEWRDVWLGGLATALLFVLGKTAIGFYLGRSTIASAYGAAGSLVVMLLWVYYSSLIFFFGAEFTRVHSRQYRSSRAQPEAGAVRVPPHLAGAKAPPEKELARAGAGTAVRTLLLLLAALAAALPAQAAEKVKVEVSGVGGDLKRNVLATLSLDEARHDKDLDEQRLRRLHAKAPDEIQTALQPFGYYRPTVKSTLEREKGTWVARYEIDPGPPLKVTVLDLRLDGPGASDPEFERRVRDFPLRQGATVLAPAYAAGKQSFVEYAAANGYLDADYTESQIRVDLASYTADVVLHFETGPRYLFGPVTFAQRFLNNDLLKGYVTFKEGEPLDVNKLLAMQTALNDSPYFQRVEVLTREDQKQGLEVPIEVDLTPSKRQHWRFGLGYGTDTGPRGVAALELRHINRRGHNAQIEFKGSGIEKSATASYQIPGAYPRTDVLTWSAGYADLRPKTSVSRRFIVGPGLTRARGEWRQAFSFDFQREVFTVGLDKGTSKLLMPQASWTLVRADDRIYTSHGQKVEIDLRAADKAIVSNASFVQAEVSGKLIRTFADRFRLITRAQLGATATSEFHALPPSIRFFAGGDESVRGYAYQQLGELDAGRHVIGGKDLLTGSVEVDYRLPALHFLERWGVAAFFDAGNARNTFSGKLETGTGVGLRWVSPIGPLRLDFAWAMTRPGHPLRIHLTVGPDL